MQRETLTIPVAEPKMQRPAWHPAPFTLKPAPHKASLPEHWSSLGAREGLEDREDQCPQKEDALALGAGTAANSKSRKTP